mmetsp:Transcript_21730/g.60508  ORF Transcript_21730/g.60508 Transcript_21730/m.60508 type:complete len:99 (+) Transcript_21730:853-1149(+)
MKSVALVVTSYCTITIYWQQGMSTAVVYHLRKFKRTDPTTITVIVTTIIMRGNDSRRDEPAPDDNDEYRCSQRPDVVLALGNARNTPSPSGSLLNRNG